MLRIWVLCLIVPLITGCAALSQGRRSESVVAPQTSTVAVTVPVKHEVPKRPVVPKPVIVPKPPQPGFISGMTDFRGLLKAPYVRLLIAKRDDPSQQFFIYFGSKGNQSVVPWGTEKVVEPGYFVIELAPGAYKIIQIAIPVGSTIADEGMELDFDVLPGKAVYVGTLEVDGTKEKVKFGGVPLIRPGFAYHLFVRDEIADALGMLKGMLPESITAVEKRLFTVVSATEDGLPPTEMLKPGVKK